MVNEQDKTIQEPAYELKVFREADVVAVGGGPAGFAAAVAAGRNGADTVGRKLKPNLKPDIERMTGAIPYMVGSAGLVKTFIMINNPNFTLKD